MKPSLSEIVQQQIKTPSPIRQIMKMADRKNIINMGLDPDDVISFGGGWVNHRAPERLREIYREIIDDEGLFHKSGGYSATPGDMEAREALARMERHLFNMDIGPENIIIGQGSTQLTHDVFKTIADPGDGVVLLDPTYANYEGQLTYTLGEDIGDRIEARIYRLRAMDTESWEFMPDPDDAVERLKALFTAKKPKIVLFPSPDNPTSQIPPESFVKAALEISEDYGAYLILDFAYKTQVFGKEPSYFSWSPREHENLIAILSNSKWGRGLGRRLGWLEASEDVIAGMERTQQVSILCPDTLHQMATTRYINESIEDGSLRRYVEEVKREYERAAEITIKAIDDHLGMRRLVPKGGLYTVMEVGMDGDDFVRDVLKNTGVLFIPGKGFGRTLENAVRISYGPLVNQTEKIVEGMERVGRYLGRV